MKLHKGARKLAGFYLAILMAITLFFSAAVYQLSVQELERNLRRPGPNSAINRLPRTGPDRITAEEILQEREDQFEQARSNILQRILITNLAILLGGGILSYYLAVRTLRPIEEAHDAQSRFTADASHELRTPIAAMRAETEVALNDPKLNIKKAKELMSSNIEELAKLTALTEGLLKLANAENGELPRSSLYVKPLVASVIADVRERADKKNIKIGLETPAQLKVLAEETSLREALIILLDNAIKYSPEKTSVAVTAVAVSKYVEIAVADQGIGIKSTELPHIFERFYRADSARSKQKVEGYGLGLAIAKSIVELNNGQISVTSTPGKGTVMTMRLPKA